MPQLKTASGRTCFCDPIVRHSRQILRLLLRRLTDNRGMPAAHADERLNLLSTLPPTPRNRRLAWTIVGLSALIFAAVAPFARVPLAPVWAFIPIYQSALVVSDLVTAVLLYGQFATSRSRALLLIASGYMFTALIAVVHGLTFPGLFAPTGLLGAGPQTTAWLYMFWHAGFPLAVIGYAFLKSSNIDTVSGKTGNAIATSIAAAGAAALIALATAGHAALPAIMVANHYTPAMIAVIMAVWSLSFVALIVLWRHRPHSVLDLWLMVVVFAWLLDIALAVILNAGRFDLGFYIGRIYGLCAASFVLMVLLVETGALYAQISRLLKFERANRRTLVDSSPLPIFSIDADGNVASWNSAAERVFAYAAADIVGRPFASLPENAPNDYLDLHRRVTGGEPVRGIHMSWQRADGSTIDVVCSGAPVREAGQRSGAVYIAEDVTEKKRLESQLAQAQKMEAVGQLTGGIAHDFNNLLTAVFNGIDTLRESASETERAAAVDTIDSAATRAAELTRHLLAFARKQPLQPHEVDINGLVADATKLLRATLGAQIDIEIKLANDVWPALVDPNQLTSAILNLSINARDAMPNGGRLTIETRSVVLDEDYAKAHSEVVAGPYLLVAVSDNGTGIPASMIDKVFEPFFTTKGVGKGTGLGLSMVFGFIKQSGGHIKIYSEEGQGTSVKMYLPRASGIDVAANEVSIVPQQRGTERILVVEDNELVRRNVVKQLESLGYRTLEASTGTEAITLIERDADIDLLFTDLIMPGGMNGCQLAERVASRQRSIKVLFTSGYTEEAVLHQGRLDPGLLLLGKPYRKAELARMVRQALAS